MWKPCFRHLSFLGTCAHWVICFVVWCGWSFNSQLRSPSHIQLRMVRKIRRSWKHMVKDTELEFPKCADRWPVLLGMVKIMEDLPDSAEDARPSDMTDFRAFSAGYCNASKNKIRTKPWKGCFFFYLFFMCIAPLKGGVVFNCFFICIAPLSYIELYIRLLASSS